MICDRCITGAELVMVDNSRGPVHLHSNKPPVQADVDGVQLASLLGAVGLPQALGRIGRDAVPRDLVLPDPGLDRWLASRPRARP